MEQIEYRNRELTSYPKINHVFVSSNAVLRQEHFPASTKQLKICVNKVMSIHRIHFNLSDWSIFDINF